MPTLAQQTVTTDADSEDPETQTTEYISGPTGQPFEQWDSNTGVSYYYQDRMGSTRVLMDNSRDVQATYDYTPYGQLTAVGGDSSASTDLLFDGCLTDTLGESGGSGLVYMSARWYDPATMQFMSLDPAVEQTMQPYAFTNDDPLNAIDMTGLGCDWLHPQDCAGDIAGDAGATIHDAAGWLTSAPGWERGRRISGGRGFSE